MIVIIYFLYFVAGICFIQFILPLGDSIISLAITFIEMLKSKMNVRISNNNTKIMSSQDGGPVHAIGFQLPVEEVQEEEDEDENE